LRRFRDQGICRASSPRRSASPNALFQRQLQLRRRDAVTQVTDRHLGLNDRGLQGLRTPAQSFNTLRISGRSWRRTEKRPVRLSPTCIWGRLPAPSVLLDRMEHRKDVVAGGTTIFIEAMPKCYGATTDRQGTIARKC
jgi:hypothetical protein